ncbi:MAG: Coq4 family protein [Myxococcota bacterium]|nr:Coq4 family protein [Myxococcota bacterium]
MPAAPIHLGRVPAKQAKRVATALYRVLRDSTATDEIVVAEEITAQEQLRYWLRDGIFESEEGRRLYSQRPEIAATDLDTLRALPDDSLGREFARFLDDHSISLAGLAQGTPFTEGDDEAYLMRRIRQCHDLWHVLLGLGTEGHEEVLVHCFSVAQTGFPYSLIVIGLGSLKHMVLEGRWSTLRTETRAAWRCGANAAPILGVFWEERWSQPLAMVRRELGIEVIGAQAVAAA